MGAGLGQGCCLALLLFNIFLAAVFEAWQAKSGGGVVWQTRVDVVLHHRETFDKRTTWQALTLEELSYADDAALISSSLLQLRETAQKFQAHLGLWGVTLSVEKAKALTTEAGEQSAIAVEEFDGFDDIEFCKEFEYLGVTVDGTTNGDRAVFARIHKARKAFWALNSSVWSLKQLSIGTKVRVFRACVMSALLFGAELWTPTFVARKALERVYRIWLRRLANFGLRKQWEHSVSNADLRAWLGVPPILQVVRQCRLRWLGHVGRMQEHRLPKQILFGPLPEELGYRQPGHQAGKRLREEFLSDLAAIDVHQQGWLQFCNTDGGRAKWAEKSREIGFWFMPLEVDPTKPTPDRKVDRAIANSA